ncbi:MAG: polyprenol monophosphomannose synthase, partial [bacterium]|nr:polyprenol monophosphomannose synthase [bacterium]
MKKVVVVLPTYNEKETILSILEAIVSTRRKMRDVNLCVLVVDDNSPDGTGELVRNFIKTTNEVYLITGQKNGLGKAYIRGFKYALESLEADIVMEMDADFSHDPNKIPELVAEVVNGADFVIGSRYVKGGSIPSYWPRKRVWNSKISNLLARYVAGIYGVADCTGGFRAISKEILEKVDLNRLNVAGYAFQINLLHRCLHSGAIVKEIPIHFKDRELGKSKIGFSDIIEFGYAVIGLRISATQTRYFIGVIMTCSFGVSYWLFTLFYRNNGHFYIVPFVVFLVLFLSIVMTIQGVMTLIWMYYAWQDSERINLNRSPDVYIKPEISFTALLPARHEEAVIFDTIKAVSLIDYPEELK